MILCTYYSHWMFLIKFSYNSIVNLILLLQLREDLKKGVYVENLTEYNVRTVNDVVKLLLQVWIFGSSFSRKYSLPHFRSGIIGIILSYTGCCKQKNGGNSYEQWEQPFPQCFYLYHWKPLGERFHESIQICKVKFSRSSWFWKVTIVPTISFVFSSFSTKLDLLLIGSGRKALVQREIVWKKQQI